MKMPISSKPTWLNNREGGSDFTCPHCRHSLEWNEDNLYDFTWEHVKCSECDAEFDIKRKVTHTFEFRGRE